MILLYKETSRGAFINSNPENCKVIEALVGKVERRTWSQCCVYVKLYCLTDARGWYMGNHHSDYCGTRLCIRIYSYYKRSNTLPKGILMCIFNGNKAHGAFIAIYYTIFINLATFLGSLFFFFLSTV